MNKLAQLSRIIETGQALGLDITQIVEKFNSICKNIEEHTIKIVLLGSFSDGKTTAIAGILGHLEKDTMKISTDESSDEICVYHPANLKKGFEIVDTPGLFGTKEKEIDGKNVKFSDITIRYISEAHIILYVCDAVNPLKESHVEIIRKVLRDYNKLSSTIFVINKMDEAGYDLTDDEDYANGAQIKKQNLISRLRSKINLTPDEEKNLNIVCIAADPKSKGLQYWFEKRDDYKRRSHIDILQRQINCVVNKSNVIDLKKQTSITSIKDMLNELSIIVHLACSQITTALDNFDEKTKDLLAENRILRNQLISNRQLMYNRLDDLKKQLLRKVNGASLDTISNIIIESIGVEDETVSFNILMRDINQIISECNEANDSAINKSNDSTIKVLFQEQDGIWKDALNAGVPLLKGVNIQANAVKAARDVIAKGHKFKPWGAVKLAKNISKGLAVAGGAIEAAMQVWDWIKDKKNQKRLLELQNSLCNAINSTFNEAFNLFDDENKYFENFAPSYIELNKTIESRQQDTKHLRDKIDEMLKYKQDIESYNFEDIEDADFEVIQ